jgi:hypothetical protein
MLFPSVKCFCNVDLNKLTSSTTECEPVPKSFSVLDELSPSVKG